jgi:hypothetical protein
MTERISGNILHAVQRLPKRESIIPSQTAVQPAVQLAILVSDGCHGHITNEVAFAEGCSASEDH